MVFRDENNQQIHLSVTNHINKERVLGKGNETFRLPPNFNNAVFKKIVLELNLKKYIDTYIIAVLEYNNQERIHFLFKIEPCNTYADTIIVVLVSSLITKVSILPYKKVPIDKRIFIEKPFNDILNEIENEKNMVKILREEREEKNRLRSLAKKANAIPLRNGGLKIVKKRDINL